ncbi:fatty acid desaturase [uncultured Sphingomonas sp.]|uniref:fatty acid desaturase n=1 Tax=uncultured Sphingomonas sp. TaxID=158754 RepID=UPI002601FA40|nr:fatty acid desaturase [uncultured Sphingomonas sp.]
MPFFMLWLAASWCLQAGIWVGLALTVPAGALLLRLFLIQHDCGHGSFFRRRRANTWAGRILGVLTLTPYEFWRRTHAQHHARTGNLDHRGVGDIDTLTLAEYLGLSRSARWRYRLYRSPLVLFGLGPAYQFLLRHRVPAGMLRGGWRNWTSVMMTNLGVAALWLGMMYAVGPKTFLLVQIPTTLIAATLGVWLFYIQHQFEETSWHQDEAWSFQEAALHGSSYYDLPPLLRWFSAEIGVHHVHHLCSTIPFYRMQAVLRSFPQLKRVGRLGLRESFGTIRLTLWDEQRRRMISFADAGAARPA